MKYTYRLLLFCVFTEVTNTKKEKKLKVDGWYEIIDRGITICEKLKHPSGDSSDFIEDLQIYYESLEAVMEGLKKNKSESLQDYVKLQKIGGPPHLQYYPVSPVAYLVDYYEWDTFSTWQFRGLMKYTWVLWLDMQDYVKEHFSSLQF